MEFAEAGKLLPAESGAEGYAPIPQWCRRRGDRADLSDLVFESSVVCIGHVREHVAVALRNLVGLVGDRGGITRARRK